VICGACAGAKRWDLYLARWDTLARERCKGGGGRREGEKYISLCNPLGSDEGPRLDAANERPPRNSCARESLSAPRSGGGKGERERVLHVSSLSPATRRPGLRSAALGRVLQSPGSICLALSSTPLLVDSAVLLDP
jgi:hypothetical protein